MTCKEVPGEVEIRGTASSSNQIDIGLNFQKPTDYENSAPPLFEINEENLNSNGLRGQFQAEAFNLFGWSKAPITTEPTE